MAYPILAKKRTWWTQGNPSAYQETFTEINFVDSYTPTGSETESWDASANRDGSITAYVDGATLIVAGNGSGKIALSADASYMFIEDLNDKKEQFRNVASINGAEILDTSGTTNMTSMLWGCSSLKNINVNSWDTSNVTKMAYLFERCESIESLDLSSWNLDNVEWMESIFAQCKSLTTLNISTWNPPKLTSLSGVFSGCVKLKNLDMSNLTVDSRFTNLSRCFSECKTLSSFEFLSGWDTSNVTDMAGLFEMCELLDSLDIISGWDVSKLNNMRGMFADCSSITSYEPISGWDVGNVTDFSNIFRNCAAESLDCLNDWDVSRAFSLSYMVYGSTALKRFNLNKWNVSKVRYTGGLFSNCTSIESIDISNWDVSSVDDALFMFSGYSSPAMPDMSNWKFNSLQDMRYLFYNCTSAAINNIDFSKWDVSHVTDMESMFAGCVKLTSLDVSNWDTSKVKAMRGMFYKCSALTSLDVSNWDTSSVTNMELMFTDCSLFTSLDVSKWNTSNVTTMYGMFAGCVKLTSLDVSKWNTGKVKNFGIMFASTSNYSENPMKLAELDVSNWNMSSATNISFMFYACQSLKNLDISNWDVSKVSNFDHMLAHSHYSGDLDVSKWDTSSATNMNAMFHSVKVEFLDVSSFDTSNVTVFSQMFEYMSKLKKIVGLENFDTSKGIAFHEMFQSCSSLEELNLSSFDTRSAKDGVTISTNGGTSETLRAMFNGCNKLSKIILGENFSFNGDGTTTSNVGMLPTPSNEYIRHADGNWYTEADEAILPADVSDGVLATYYAVASKYRDFVLVTRGSLSDIAESIRDKMRSSDLIYPDDMAAQIPQVFDAGVKSEYDRFWDNYQENGNRTDYSRAFSNGYWNNELFKPKYDICPVKAETMFYTNYSITDPEAVLNALGLKLDFSRCTNFVQFLSWAAVQRLSIVDTRNTTTLRLAFYAAINLQTIEKLILAEDGSQTIESSTSFANVPKLREIRIEGLFGQSVSFYSSSLLSLESLRSIINALKDYSGTGTTQTITLNPTSKSYLTDNDIAQITQKGWTLA